MSRILLLVFLFLSIHLSAQITTDSFLIQKAAPNTNSDHKTTIKFVNEADTSVFVYWMVIKDGRTWEKCWNSYVCDLILCYSDNIDTCAIANEVFPGEFSFDFHIKDNGCPGSTVVGLKLFADENFTQELLCMNINVNTFSGNLNFCTSSASDEALSDVRIFPNPVHQYLNIEGNNIKNIQIFSMLGLQIQNIHYDNGGSLDVSHLNSGMYFIKLTSDNNHSKSFKFFKN